VFKTDKRPEFGLKSREKLLCFSDAFVEEQDARAVAAGPSFFH
jgi:hypothetical protein